MGMRIGGGVARQLQTLFDSGAVGSMGDGELLGRFLRRDASAERAFAALVDRHGRMVLRVCREVLGDPHEAQDAAQATFFILARRAGTIRQPEALPSWLHGTARRVASRALRESIRRRCHERRSVETGVARDQGDPEPPRTWPELHEELSRLPDRYREPIVLCDLAGMTHEQAATRLGCPPRTLQTRLYRGRERLKDRLIRRGLTPASALVGVSWATESHAATPLAWAAPTASAAVRLSSGLGWAAVGEVPAGAVRLARANLKEMVLMKLKWVAAAGLLIGAVVGVAWSKMPAQGEGSPQVSTQKQSPAAVPTPKPAQAQSGNSTAPITVSGRAIDPEGKSIAGARVFLASRRADYRRVAETLTDAQGRYQFREVALPIERSTTVSGLDSGAFQVFGEADGFGFAWRPVKWVFPEPRPANITYQPERIDPPGRYEPGDRIELDLRFSPAARLAGTIVNAFDKPIPGVRLEIRECETLAFPDPNVIGGWRFDTLNERDSAPASMKIRATDALGRFDFQGMPADCRFRIDVAAKGFPGQTFYAATTLVPPPIHDGAPVLTGEIKVALATPVNVPIKMEYGDTHQPAPRVAVQAARGFVSELETSDDHGLATLRLPAGVYRMENWPARGTPYLVTEAQLTVGETPPDVPPVYTLRRAAELEVTVVDEQTGEGLPDVNLWHESEDGRRQKFVMKSWEVATRIAWRDSPRSDAQGRLRAFVEPGRHRFGVGLEAYPRGMEVVEARGQEVECRAGQTATLRFTMRKRR